MIDMIRDAPAGLEQSRDAGTGPQVGSKTRGLSAPSQPLGQTTFSGWRQTGWSSRCRFGENVGGRANSLVEGRVKLPT
jgi:hypothetical protein